jgi:uncharacterized sulfatase
MLFKQTYCQYAICGPSRTSLLSGYRPDKTQIFDNRVSPRSHLGVDFKFLPEYFQENNYYTERFGKIGPCGHEKEVTWDSVYRSHAILREDTINTPAWWIDTLHKTDDQTLAGVLTTGLLKSLRNPPASPYFFAYGIWTHNPWTPILSEWNKIGDPTVQELLPVDKKGTLTNVIGNGSANISLPNTPADDLDDIPSVALKPLFQYPSDEWKRYRHSYYAEIAAMDFHLGQILDEMDSLNLWDNSVVVFWSDHGIHLGEHNGLWLKQTLFEEALRIPFVICAPGKKVGICDKLVELVDIFPTLTELCGLPKPPGLEGSSLVPLLENPDAQWKKCIFAQVTRNVNRTTIMGRAVRTDSFEYNSWESYGEELYDLINDPYQYTNLVTDTAYNTTLDQMRLLLANGWQNAAPPPYLLKTYYKDADGDKYGTNSDSIIAYFPSDNYVSIGGDCNDANPNIHPGALEKNCNGVDDNCNGKIDENRPVPTITALGSLDICAIGSVELQTISGNGYNYQWVKNNVDIPGATQRLYTAVGIGDYNVKVSDAGGCGNISKKVTVTSSCIIASRDSPSLKLIGSAGYP